MAFRIGVISDTHLRQVTKQFKRLYEEFLADKDLVIHAGDIVCEEVIDFLSQKPLKAVCGNMDPFELRKRLPSKEILEIEEFTIGIIHGWGPSAGLEQRVLNEIQNADVIVYGHSHHPANEAKEGVLLFNPGTATGYPSAGFNSVGVLEISDTVQGKIIRL
ncbi:MAG: metallophosphoesterase family protein [Deltaproteobacteria bacterium]|nr:metallophosphoesterase family protein [Deltaproteobacteria bacterium]MBW2081501.1 metallophosphoesterase family protein [Deltaproteobacteria bacterium]